VSETVHVFVYGTLRADEANDIRGLVPPPRFLGLGVVHGELFDYGHHPGIVLCAGGSTVQGEIYACEPALLPVLDRIELDYPERPGLYRHSSCEVDCGDRSVRCLVYELTDGGRSSLGRVLGADPVDWVAWRRARGG